MVEALKAQKAQQAAERLKRGRGAPETGQDYVFTGPEGGLLNVNAFRDRNVVSHTHDSQPEPQDDVPDPAPVRLEYLGRGRGAVLSGGDAGACEPRDALQRLRALHPEPDTPGRQRAHAPDGGDGDGCETRGGDRCGTPEILPLRSGATECTKRGARLAIHGAEGGTRTPTGCPTRPSNVRVCQFRHFGPAKAKYAVAPSGLSISARAGARVPPPTGATAGRGRRGSPRPSGCRRARSRGSRAPGRASATRRT